jgi:hypothetical protein
MEKSSIQARIKRNKFDELAGEFYRDDSSDIIKEMINEGKKVFCGIQNNNGVYTIIGERSVYYTTITGSKGEIPHSAFIKILRENALSLGKKGKFEFVDINEHDSIWVYNPETMNAMWNLLLLFESNHR